MVGLLIVSHSAQIASGIKDLVEQVAGSGVPVSAAGGTLTGGLGTSPDMIRAGFDAIATADGVLVLMDLGSAILSTECALESATFPVRLSNAPLVEGAVLAAVEASAGADLQRTAAAAERARELQKIHV